VARAEQGEADVAATRRKTKRAVQGM
jgi:hypothetical protein